jgi:hypothetical protein
MKRLTIHYNSKCNFCVNIKNIISRLDKKNQIDFVPLSDEETKLMVIDENGNKYFSEETLPVIADILPGIKRFSWMFKGDMGKKASKLFYSGLEKIRDLHNKVHGNPPCSNC